VAAGAHDRVSLLLTESTRLLRRGELGQAAARCRDLLALSPAHPEGVHWLGICLLQLGQAQGLEMLERSVALDPKRAMFWHNYGRALSQRGDLARGERALATAAELDPRNATICNDLGAARQLAGRIVDAAAAYHAALTLDPRNAQAADNYGHCLVEMGDTPGAVASFRKAVELDPGNAEAWCSLGGTLRSLGDPSAAREALHRAVRCAPDLVPAWQELALVLPECRLAAWDEAIAQQLAAVLLHPGIDGGIGVASAASTLALLDPRLTPFLPAPGADGEPDIARERLPEIARPLLLALLENAIVCDVGLERLLRRVRDSALEAWSQTGLAGCPDALLELLCALAQQCFHNEYVYPETGTQAALLEKLAARVRGGATPAEVALLACYRPLRGIAGLVQPRTDAPAFARVWQRQVAEPAAEAALARAIPALTPIRDATSVAVRGQYEENPYPRWYRAPARLDGTLSLQRLIAELFPHFDTRRLTAPPRPAVLVAGCGTGHHAIDVAGALNSRVLAVDLSLASLAYAVRRCREIGLADVQFAQADLLELGCVEERFDLVVCGGVLMALRDPLAGWRVLVSLLQPGGAMKISVYSDIAHREITAARELVAGLGLKPDLAGIRAARELILALPQGHPLRHLTSIVDFYSASEFRDMVMHVQEIRFTTGLLREYIATLGLEFLGFDDLKEGVMRRYRERFPGDPKATSLECWGRFEEEHPRTFAKMYQFWVFKP
jgi:Flp pilus assembly protein TadD/SAM-dependent methyltransferase